VADGRNDAVIGRILAGRGGLTKKADAPVPKEAAAEARPEKVAHDVPTHLKLLPLKLDKMPKESIRAAAGEIDVVCRRRRRIPMVGAIIVQLGVGVVGLPVWRLVV